MRSPSWTPAPSERPGGARDSRPAMPSARHQIRSFFASNRRLSRRFDSLFPQRIISFHQFVPALERLLAPGKRVVDIGGGRSPVIGLDLKKQLGLHVTGVDINADELELAP